MPGASSTDIIAASLKDIAQALQQPETNAPLSKLQLTEREALQLLNALYNKPAENHKTDTAQLPRVEDTNKESTQKTVTWADQGPANIPATEDTPLPRVENDTPVPRVEVETVQEEDEIPVAAPTHTHNTRHKQDNKYYNAFIAETPPEEIEEATQEFVEQALHAMRINNELYANQKSIQPPDTFMPKGYALKVTHPDTGEQVEYNQLKTSSEGKEWMESCSDEIGRLAQGNSRVKGTNTIHFITYDKIPEERRRDVTYARLVVALRPNKAVEKRCRLTAGGDKINYPFETSTRTADLITAKLLFNSTISTEGAKFMGIDIKDFYLNNKMKRFEYMKIPMSMLPDDIIGQYNLKDIEVNGYVYVEIRKGMYGLPQAGRIASEALKPHLEKHGYYEAKHTHGLFKHKTRPVTFCLIVDDFGVKYIGEEHAKHLVSCLKEKVKPIAD